MPGSLRNVPRPEALAASLSLAVSLILLGVKFTAYYLTGSAAIFSDALESIVNVMAALVAGYSLYLAHQPPDAQHPYGHGKAEFLSAGFEGGMILFAAAIIAWRAIEEMIQGPGVHEIDIGLLLIVLAGIVNGAVGLLLRRSGRRRGSPTLVADGEHLLTDAITSAAVMLALLIMWFVPAWTWVDPIAALLVAGYIAVTGVRLVMDSAAGLMDRQDAHDEALLHQILGAHVAAGSADGADGGARRATDPCICSYHKLRHRHSGRYHWVDFHIMVPAHWSIARGHEVASAIEYEIERALGEGNATAHVEPCGDSKCSACA